MTGDRSRLRNFIKKFIRTIRFGNDHFGAIMGYGDYVIGDSVISRVYYVEGLGHNLFFVRQFCDSDLEVTFRKHSCYVRDMDGVELIKGSRGSNLYTISVEDMMKSSSICLLSKASKNKSCIFHQKSVLRTPQQNGVVERQKRTLVEAARTMLIFCKAPMFLWAEAVATAFFGALSYLTNDSEDLGKLQPTSDIGIFLSEPMAPVQLSIGPATSFLTPGQISSGLIPNSVPAAPYVPVISACTPSFTTIDQDAPSPSHSPSSSKLLPSISHQGVAAGSPIIEDNPFDHVDNNPFINVFALEPSSEASSSGDVSSAESTHVTQPHHHLRK
ncbi:retrovirus-related pol polyprotein from transposon TNT 1-94 [Tanacetum coccineum]